MRGPNFAGGGGGGLLGGLGGRSIYPSGSKVVPYNTEGRFQLDKPAPATQRRPRVLGWGTARKAGASGEPGTAGEGPWGSPRLSWLGPWWAGVVGECSPPASPGTAAWTQIASRWCVLVSILCPPVHDMLLCNPGTPKLPADCVLVPGSWLSCAVRHGAGKNFPCSHTLAVPGSRRSAAGCAETAETRWWDILGNVLGPWLGGEGAASRRPP